MRARVSLSLSPFSVLLIISYDGIAGAYTYIGNTPRFRGALISQLPRRTHRWDKAPCITRKEENRKARLLKISWCITSGRLRDNVTYSTAGDISRNAAPRRNLEHLESGQPFLLSRVFSFDVSPEAGVRWPRQRLMNIPVLVNKILQILLRD